MSLPHYAEVAEKLDIWWCTGLRDGRYCHLSPETHDRGFADRDQVHWRDRRVTRAGLFHFLWLASKRYDGMSLDPWARSWIRIRAMRSWLKALGLKLPKAFWLERRAILVDQLARSEVPTDPGIKVQRKRAQRWAHVGRS